MKDYHEIFGHRRCRVYRFSRQSAPATAGHHVVEIDTLDEYDDVSLKQARLDLLQLPNFHFAKIDFADNTAMAALFADEQFNRAIHLAAQAGVHLSLENPHACAQANLIGHLNIQEGRPNTWCTPPQALSMV